MPVRYSFLLFIITLNYSVFAIDPSYEYYLTPDSLNLQYKTITLETSDNFKLKGWEVSPNQKFDKKTTVVIAYGDAGNMSSCLYQASGLSKAGFRVVLFDYRGFGQSQPYALNKKQLYYNEFSLDLLSAIRYAKQINKNNKVGILALSMGTIMSTIAISKQPVDFLITEGYVSDPLIIKNRLKQMFNKDVVLPTESDTYTSLLPAIKCKVLIIAGTDDKVTPISDAKEIVAQRVKKRKIQYFKGGHLQGFDVLTKNVAGDLYISAIVEFLK